MIGRVVLAIVVLLVAIVAYQIVVVEQQEQQQQQQVQLPVFPHPSIPTTTPNQQQPTPGIYTQPPTTNPNITCSSLRLKQWKYMNFVNSNTNTLLAVAVIDVGYMREAFVIAYSPTNGFQQSSRRSPPHIPLFSPTVVVSINNNSQYGDYVKITSDSVTINCQELNLIDETINFTKESDTVSDLSLVYPLTPNRFAYTWKPSLLRVVNQSNTNKEFQGLQYATMDFTYSCELRETIWRWASTTGRDKNNKRFQINLTSNNRFGDSENVLFFEDKRYMLGSVEFTEERDGLWTRIKSNTIDLTFSPLSIKPIDINALLVRTKFSQAIGFYSGTITIDNSVVIELDQVMGVGEDHYALW